MLKKVVIGLVVMLASNTVLADWVLDNKQSHLNFVSTKKSTVAEVHHFDSLTGAINNNGKVAVEVKLDSVETFIPVRNERLKALLFEIPVYPVAKITTAINADKMTALQVGETVVKSVKMKVSLHGLSQTLKVAVRFVKLSDSRLLATSIKPIVINANDYKLVAGIEKLREVAHLPSISTAVPVTFSFIFNQK